MKYKEFLKTAFKAAKESGKIVKEGFLNNKTVKYKKFADPVTEFDKKSEAKIVDIISKKFPDHDILTEEELSKNTNSNIKWIIDPIDGTVNFIHSIPFIAISIALEIDGKIILGVAYNPVLNEFFFAVKDQGAYFNNSRIFVSKNSEIGKSLIVTGFPYEREGRIKELIKPLPELIKNYQGFRRLGSAVIDMAYVACGKFDAFYEENLKPWDTASGKIIVEEAGGKITDYSNNEYSIYNKMILATNSIIHDSIVKLLKSIRKI